VAGVVARELKQHRAFVSHEQEVLLGLQIAATRIMEPWGKFLKTTADLTPNQYNVLRILRGSHPARLACSDVADRMITHDPDITRLIDRLATRSLVERSRSEEDRRVVVTRISSAGLKMLSSIDEAARTLPQQALGHLGEKKLRALIDLLEEARKA